MENDASIQAYAPTAEHEDEKIQKLNEETLKR